MAKIHVLTRSGVNVFTVVIHTPTPAGNNLAGVAWSTAVQNSGRAITQMIVGNGAGQISQAEANQVVAGTLIEAAMQWGDDPSWTALERQQDLDLRATQLANETLERYQQDLKYFGFTRT